MRQELKYRHRLWYDSIEYWYRWSIYRNGRLVANGCSRYEAESARHRDAMLRQIADDAVRAGHRIELTPNLLLIERDDDRPHGAHLIASDEQIQRSYSGNWWVMLKHIRLRLIGEAWDRRRRVRRLGDCAHRDVETDRYQHELTMLRLVRLLQRQGPACPLVAAADQLIAAERALS